MKVTISGGSGFLGRRLLKSFVADGHCVNVLSRHPGTNMPAQVKLFTWEPIRGEPPAESLCNTDAVIHLAGEPVAQRWNNNTKQQIRESRVTGTRHLVEALGKLRQPPPVLVCASAIGYYGSRGEETLSERSPPGAGFLPEVCAAWENEASKAGPLGIRVVHVRIGIVLDSHGGALQRMLPPFRMGVGGKLGDGSQWMSWIHLDDLVGLLRFPLGNRIAGPINGVAPNPVTNAEFTKALAAALHRPAIFPVPAFVLRTLFGEMSEILLASQRVVPKVAEEAGFRFRFPELAATLADIVK